MNPVIDVKRTRSGPTSSTAPVLDDLDRQLLQYLQREARLTSVELARRLRLSSAGLHKRVRKLEAQGVIEGYTARLSRHALGLDLLCFVQVSLAHHQPARVERFPDRIRAMPEVLECHYLTGEVDYLLKVVVASHQELERFLFDKLMKVAGVDRVRTSIALKEVKSSTVLPL